GRARSAAAGDGPQPVAAAVRAHDGESRADPEAPEPAFAARSRDSYGGATLKHARSPLSPAVIYLAIGLLAGPLGLSLLAPALNEDGWLIEAVAEAAVAISLLCVGLRLRAPLQWNAWKLPLRLGTVTMLATMAMIAGAAHVFFELSFAQALLLGAILAPTD